MRDFDPAPRPVNPAWCSRIFGARAAQTGGVVRRKKRDVHREIGYEAFVAEVRARGFHLIECGDQYLVICHDGHLRVIC
jgi:hypothetical protein